MAGPLSSEEIEDVVSSVRRLVSNEQRVKTRDLTAERLVLTSAYRVVPETSPLSVPPQPLSPLMLDAPLVEPPEPVVHPPDPIAALEDSLAQALDVEVDAEPVRNASASAPVDAVEAEWEDELWTEPAPVSLGEVALAAEEAEVLMAPEPEPDVLHPAADEVMPSGDASSAWIDEPIPFVPLRRRAEDLAARVAAGAVVDLPTATVGPDAAPADPAIPDPVAGTFDPEPGPVEAVESCAPVADEPVVEAPVAEAPAVEPPAEEPPAVEPPADVTDTNPAPSTASRPIADLAPMATDLYDEDGTPLAVLDEAALNEIVRQVLRAELQGELGERITRNVRKLVRAEINRALIARDLD